MLAKRGVKVKAKSLAAARNTKSDSALTQAATNNVYDQTFRRLIEGQLADYQKQLRAAYNSGTTSEKKFLAATYTRTSLLLPKTATQE